MADHDSDDTTRPEHTDVEQAPTVASVATVASGC